MAHEGEFVLLGIVIFLAGLGLVFSPLVDNLFTLFTGYNEKDLQKLAIICLFGGAGIAITAFVTAKKSA